MLLVSKTTDCPTDAQIAEAVKTLRSWFPEDAALAHASDTELTQAVQSFYSDGRVLHVAGGAGDGPAMLRGVSPCQMAQASVVLDVVLVALGFFGLHVKANEAMERAVLRFLTGSAEKTFQALIRALARAESATEQATAIWNILEAALKTGIFRAVIGIVKDDLSTWDWILIGLSAVAQIIALVASEGAAFIAELVLQGATIAFLVSDAVKAEHACA